VILDALLLSIAVTGASTVFVAVTGTVLGRWLAGGGSWRNGVDAIVSAPLVLPPTVTGFLLIALFGRRGPIGRWFHAWDLDLTFTPFAAVLAAVVVSLPLMVRSARAAFEAIDPAYGRLAQSLGCPPRSLARRIEWPLARRGLAAGAALAFGRALGEFGATLMIAGNLRGRTQTLPLAVYESFLRGDDRAAWIAVGILTLGSFAVLAIARRLGDGR